MLYGYARVSTQDQVNGTSLDEQKRMIQGAAMIRNEPVARIFVDGGVSGAIPLSQRLEGGEMFALAQEGDCIVASKLDRVFRDAADAQMSLNALQKRGVDLIIVDVGTDSVTKNGSARLVFGVLASVAEWERSRIKERQSSGQRAKRENGGFLGGVRPFGYEVRGHGKASTLVPIPEEQAAIEKMKVLKDSGLSLREISAEIQKDGHKVSHVSVGKILSRK